MANNEMDIENEGSASKFERFLFLMIPIIFTLVLLGVLLTLFNMDIRKNVLEIANKIPIVEKWVPDPPQDEAADGETDPKKQSEDQAASSEKTIKELKSQLAKQAEQLRKATEDKTAQETKSEALQKQIDGMKAETAAAEASTEAQAEDPYVKQVTELAKLYSGMKASKAAPIMENLTTDEMVQIFSVMNNASKTAILEKMDPKKAADVTVKLKETANSTDMAIAALQSRLKQEAASASPTPAASTGTLDLDKVSQTFTTMPAADAASLLDSMYKVSPDRVVKILSALSDSVRSSILGEMTKKDSAQTAKVVNRLMGK